MRQADVYVFCVENCKDQEVVNPLDLSQWDFYPVSTEVLNATVRKQKTIGLNALIAIGVRKCFFADLRKNVIALTMKSDETTDTLRG